MMVSLQWLNLDFFFFFNEISKYVMVHLIHFGFFNAHLEFFNGFVEIFMIP